MSTYKLEISPKIENPESKLIIGGNKKIRLIDIKNKDSPKRLLLEITFIIILIYSILVETIV